MMLRSVLVVLLLATAAWGKIYLQEDFGTGWEARWVVSESREDLGAFASGCGAYREDADGCINTSQDAKFYAVSTALPESFDSTGKDFVAQYAVAFPQSIDCGGGYIKLFPESLDQKALEGESEYNFMFGSDICGSTNKKVHVIVNHDDDNHLIGKTIYPESDKRTHLYALVAHPDNTFEVYVDGEEKHKGSFEDEDWTIFAAKEIDDSEDEQPEDWDAQEFIADPEAVKPADWDDEKAEVADEDAEKPEDWDDELDGEWERPIIANPNFKGEWEAPHIKNENYQGIWAPQKIANPDWAEPSSLVSKTTKYVGLDLWQVKSGTVFSHVSIADNYDDVKDLVDISAIQDAEEAVLEAEREAEAAKREAEAEAAAAAAAAAAEEAGDDDDDDDEDFEDSQDLKEEL